MWVSKLLNWAHHYRYSKHKMLFLVTPAEICSAPCWVEPWASSMLRFLSSFVSDTGAQWTGVMTALLANDQVKIGAY